MTPSAPVLYAVSTTASAAALALAFGFFPAGPALAASPEPSPTPVSGTQAPPDCGLVCLPVLASSPDAGQTGRPRKSREPAPQPAQPAPPAEAPGPPVQPPAPPADTPPAADPSAVPAASEAPPGEPVPDSASASAAAGYRPPTGPSSGQDWNSPVTRSARPTQLAAVAPAPGRGPDGPALLPTVLGALLVGVAAGAFAWWNRNRLRSH
ncbi:hypothetical protein ACFFGR_11885 [Arthrobacter liuii]|uniref:Uncharacterized protein n=1 Tax=Arthrobacter liuii TaxID=1476996 RepID=A0ABQ2AEN1_9MICC|nr:hypothetical protein [Arthrobacter liuii]GGH89722.1 hypothetical protein GCM10007170_01810 [Arthrobacter liuii]